MKRFVFFFLFVAVTIFAKEIPMLPKNPARELSAEIKAALASSFCPWEFGKNACISLALEANREFVIPLFENGTTGYQWQVFAVQEKQPAVVMLYSDFLPPQAKGIVGAGGIRLFTFKTSSFGSATLHFRYVRPWEKEAAPVQQLSLLLTILPPTSLTP